MAYGIVYLATNTANGKPYVGLTTMPLQHRWSAHVSLAKTRSQDTLLCRAIRKHGREAFTVDRIVDAPDMRTLDALERFWIGVCNSRAPSGYNTTDGGRSGTKQDAIVRERKRQAQLLRYRDPAQRARQSEGLRKRWSDPAARARQSLREIAAHADERKPVVAIRLSDGKRVAFGGRAEAARALGVHRTAIYMCLSGRLRKTGGYAFVEPEN